MGITAEQLAALQANLSRGSKTPSPTSPSLAATKKKRGEPERDGQVKLAPERDALLGKRKWFHVPNERSSKRQAGRLSEEGVKPGVPDIVAIKRTLSGKPGAVAEMKAPKHKRPSNPLAGTSPEQRAWLESYAEEGYETAVCYSAEEALAFFKLVYFGGAK